MLVYNKHLLWLRHFIIFSTQCGHEYLITTKTLHVSPITDRQTVQAQTSTDMMEHETNNNLCLRNTALLVVCQTAL